MIGRWLCLIGIGEDGLAGLSPAARALLAQAGLVVGGARHLRLAGALAAETLIWPSPLELAFPAIFSRRGAPVCVLASGDPFFYGVGSLLMRHAAPEEMLCLPAPSAFALAAARLGWAQQDCALVSLHGRALERILPHLQPGGKIIALSWDGSTPSKLAEILRARGMGASTLHVCENMGGARERLRSARADAFDLIEIDPLNTVALEVSGAAHARFLPLAPGLPDDAFEHDGQITKREIRAMSLAALAPFKGGLLWDVGAGSGSVAIEWMLRDPACRAIAVERDPARAARITRNAAQMGAPDLVVVEGEAPGALAGLPAPDAAFVGGGATHPGALDAVWRALRSGGRIVVNAVTLETQAEIIRRHAELGGELTQISVSRAESVGGFRGWRPAMPVTQWSAAKP